MKPQEGVEGEQPRLEFVTSIPVHVCETLLEYLVGRPCVNTLENMHP